jgi:oligosaccharide repeat unit polymerase
MDYLIICALICQVTLLSRLERTMFRAWFTPFTLLAWPYTVVTVLAFFFAPVLGFVSLYAPSVFIWMIGLFVFWATGFVIRLVFDSGAGHADKIKVAPGDIDRAGIKVATWVSVVIMPILGFNLRKALGSVGGLLQAGGYDFKVAYEHGLAAHALQLALPLCVYLLATYRKGRKPQLLIALSLLFFLFFTQVKGTILSVLLAALFFRTMRERSKLSIMRLVTAIAISYIFFNAVYLAGIGVSNPSALAQADIYGYFARHYMHYLWSGVLAFGEARRANVGFIGGPWYLLFSPFINLYRAAFNAGPILISGGPLELGMNIDPSHIMSDGGTNVYTMLGTLYYYVGSWGAMLVMVALGLFCYPLFLLRNRSEWILVLYCIIGSWLVFSFFEYYFASLGFPETVVYCCLLSFVSRSIRRSKGIVPSSHLVTAPN